MVWLGNMVIGNFRASPKDRCVLDDMLCLDERRRLPRYLSILSVVENRVDV